MKRHVSTAVRLMALPVHCLAHVIHQIAHIHLPERVLRLLRASVMRVVIRFTLGTIVIIVGVLIARLSHHIDNWLLSAMVDGFGYTLHAIGAAPFLAALGAE